MMPDRVVREAILTSERVDKLDAEAEVFYRRLSLTTMGSLTRT